ncbi:MAG: SurA N-terminal domain-containing protein [Desulfobacterales bacterium]|nr:SurA N-terminal domain-containing protein [Desulfobacterales bacterium]
MVTYAHKVAFPALFLVAIWSCIGCNNSGNQVDDEFLIRVGSRVITVFDFNMAFEMAKTAYPHNMIRNSDTFINAQLRLLKQIIEEQLLLEYAGELHIDVSNPEVEKAVAELKRDYPEDVFNQMLLEHAVPYECWRNGLKKRLIIEKLITQELVESIAITPEEISTYDKENQAAENPTSDLIYGTKAGDEMIKKYLRRKKAEKAYHSWINKLQKRYKIEINKAQWQKIIGSYTDSDYNMESYLFSGIFGNF